MTSRWRCRPECSPRGGIDQAASHVIVYGIMVFHPMTLSREQLYMTLR